MYCRNCGRRVEDDRELCEECEAKLKTEPVNETERVEVVEEVNNSNTSGVNNESVNQTNTQTNYTVNNNINPKSKIAAGILGIIFGAFGVHNFYLGFYSKAIAQLLITILSCGLLATISSIWGLIEGILILTGEQNTDANGVPLSN